MKRVLYLVLLLSLGLLAGGCFGPVVTPTADFTTCPDGTSGTLGYFFISQSSTVPNHYITALRWDFGDGTVLEDYYGQVSHRFPAEGTYPVTLTATDDRGVSAAATVEVEAIEVAEIRSFKLTLGWPVEVTGEVENRSSGVLHSIVVKAKFYSADGVRLTEGTTEVTAVEPGERVRFRIQAEEYGPEIFQASVLVESFSADCPSGPVPPPIYER